MSKMKNAFKISILLIAVLMLGSCSKDKEYIRVIPSNAMAVISADVSSIIKKSGLADKDQAITKKLSGVMKNEKLSKLITNPSEAGLSFKDNAYFFLTADQTPVVLIKVSDRDKLEKAFKLMQEESLCDAVQDESNYSYAVLHGYGICAFDNNSLIIMKITNPNSLPVKETVTKMMEQDIKNSIAQNGGFKKMADKKSDIGAFVSFAAMPQLAESASMMGLPEGVDIKSLMVLAHINFEKGKVAIESEYYTEDEALKAYSKKQYDAAAKIKNVFLKNIPISSLATLSLNLNGDSLYNQLLRDRSFKDIVRDSRLTPGVNLQKSISAFKGDATVAITNINEIGIPSILAYAEVTNPDAMGVMFAFKKNFDELGMSVSTVGSNEYLVRSAMLPTPIHIGLRGKTLFLTNDEACYKNICKAVPNSLNNARYQSIKEGNYGYFSLDLENITKLELVNKAFANSSAQGMVLKSVIDDFSYIEAFNKDKQMSVVNIYFKNKEENVLKIVLAQMGMMLGAN